MTLRAGPRASQGSGTPRSRLQGADALRAAALIGVLGVHAAAWGPADPFKSIDQLARFSVPAFVLLAGLALAYQYTGRELGIPFARRRATRTLLPWLVWAPVFIVFDLLTGELAQGAGNVLGYLALGAGHLWFLLLIPQFYLLFAVWPRRHRLTFALGCLLLQTSLCFARLYIAFPGWQSQVMLTYAGEIFPFWIGYFAVGVAIGDALRHPGGHRRALIAWRVPLACASIVAAVSSGYALLAVHYPHAPYGETFLDGTGAFLNPALPLFVLAIAGAVAMTAPPLMRASRAVMRAVTTLSEQSLGIYVVHPIPLFLLASYLADHRIAQRGWPSVAAYAAVVTLTLLVSLIVVRLLRATPAAATLGTTRTTLSTGYRENVPERVA